MPLPISLIGRVLCSKNVILFLWNHDELVLPFALANGLAAAFWCAVIEWRVGLAVMAGWWAASHFAEVQSVSLVHPLARMALNWAVPLSGPLGLITAAGLLWPPLAASLWPEKTALADLRAARGRGWHGLAARSALQAGT